MTHPPPARETKSPQEALQELTGLSARSQELRTSGSPSSLQDLALLFDVSELRSAGHRLMETVAELSESAAASSAQILAGAALLAGKPDWPASPSPGGRQTTDGDPWILEITNVLMDQLNLPPLPYHLQMSCRAGVSLAALKAHSALSGRPLRPGCPQCGATERIQVWASAQVHMTLMPDKEVTHNLEYDEMDEPQSPGVEEASCRCCGYTTLVLAMVRPT